MTVSTSSRKTMITLPVTLLSKIDEAADRKQMSRSGLIRKALEKYLAEEKERELQELMREGYLARAGESLGLADEFFAAENEVWDKHAAWEE